MVKQLTDLFERLAAELPPRTAIVNVYDVQRGKGKVVELKPANPACAGFSVHIEQGFDLVDFSFGLATWEFPYERRYIGGEKDLVTEIEEMCRAIIAGTCDVRRRLLSATSCIHVGGYTYTVRDWLVVSIPPFRTQHYRPYVAVDA